MIFRIFVAVVLAGALLWYSGCDQGKDTIVDGGTLDREPGDLLTAYAFVDTTTHHKGTVAQELYTFAGEYKALSSFSVFTFNRPSTIDFSTVDSVIVKFNVSSTWKDGPASFELYETTTDWPDTARVSPDMERTGPVSETTVADSITLIGSLDFTISTEYFESLEEETTFLVAGAPDCGTMVTLASAYSRYLPYFEVQRRVNEDSVSISKSYGNSGESNYLFDTGFDPADPSNEGISLISDADLGVAYMKLSLPDTIPPTASINGCTMTLLIHDAVIKENTLMVAELYRLTAPFGVLEDASFDGGSYIQFSVNDTTESVEIDVSDYITSWLKNEGTNYGMLIKPFSYNSSINQFTFSIADSIVITYSTIPDVD